jgi:hypothetical protein
MIFHFSIDADDPQRVGAAIARLWRGEVFPFPPVAEGSVIVLAGDDRNSAVEVYPRGVELLPAEGDADSVGRVATRPQGYSATHVAIATPLTQAEVLALAAEEGWIAKYRKRGGAFGVIEVWLEDRLLIEVLTPDMQAEYLAALTPGGWRAALAAGPPPVAA